MLPTIVWRTTTQDPSESNSPLFAFLEEPVRCILGASWLGPNYTGSGGWYVPLGFSSDYFSEGAPDNGSAGAASITYEVTPAN